MVGLDCYEDYFDAFDYEKKKIKIIPPHPIISTGTILE
jgi:hypothetical protein